MTVYRVLSDKAITCSCPANFQKVFPCTSVEVKHDKHICIWLQLNVTCSCFGSAPLNFIVRLDLVVCTAVSHGFLPARSHGNPYWKRGNTGLWCLTCLTCLSKDARALIYNALMDRATGKPVSLWGKNKSSCNNCGWI